LDTIQVMELFEVSTRDMVVDDTQEICEMHTTVTTIFQNFSSISHPLKRKSCKDEESEEVCEVLRGIKKIKFPVYIQVKTLNGRTIELDLDANDNIEKIKLLLLEKEGIPVAQQKLVFGGKQLIDANPISECGIVNGSILYLVIAIPHRNGYSGISFEHRVEN